MHAQPLPHPCTHLSGSERCPRRAVRASDPGAVCHGGGEAAHGRRSLVQKGDARCSHELLDPSHGPPAALPQHVAHRDERAAQKARPRALRRLPVPMEPRGLRCRHCRFPVTVGDKLQWGGERRGSVRRTPRHAPLPTFAPPVGGAPRRAPWPRLRWCDRRGAR